ncbi:Mannitol-1-phosphate 5-dehydrogenase [Caprobacter fermentans]|nr:mannitol-1-phosphate 5-dehydrogenase [Caproicibacter fermentans]MVB09976.1 Mannitol-1-phosphate 5-dehydrogenase [Caproicibacter fermentans]
MKAVHFGAGNIGRGFIGYLLSKSGYDLTFVDISAELVGNLNRLGTYKVVSLGGEKREETVGGIRAVVLQDDSGLKKAVEDADLITLSIGANHLKDTGKVLRDALQERRSRNPEQPLDVIACENALFATDLLRESVEEGAAEDFQNYLRKKVGFPNCAVDRIVPNASVQKESPIDVSVEDFYEWDVESAKVKVNSQIRGVNYVENLAPYLKRKIFLLNGAHALISYAGYRKQYRFVHEAIRDPEILTAAREFHSEAARALHLEYSMGESDLKQYSEKLIARFQNPYLKDELTRVGRDPVRKLSNNDRLVSPLLMCEKHGVECGGILYAIASGFAYDFADDPKAVEIQKSIRENGIENTVQRFTGLEKSGKLVLGIAERYRQITGKDSCSRFPYQ